MSSETATEDGEPILDEAPDALDDAPAIGEPGPRRMAARFRPLPRPG